MARNSTAKAQVTSSLIDAEEEADFEQQMAQAKSEASKADRPKSEFWLNPTWFHADGSSVQIPGGGIPMDRVAQVTIDPASPFKGKQMEQNVLVTMLQEQCAKLQPGESIRLKSNGHTFAEGSKPQAGFGLVLQRIGKKAEAQPVNKFDSIV